MMLLSFLRFIYVSVEMWGDLLPSTYGVLVSGGWPAATVGYVPTVFCLLGCRFGLPCGMLVGVLCAIYILMVSGVRVIIACLSQIYFLLR